MLSWGQRCKESGNGQGHLVLEKTNCSEDDVQGEVERRDTKTQEDYSEALWNHLFVHCEYVSL